jgi:hypothetical protein
MKAVGDVDKLPWMNRGRTIERLSTKKLIKKQGTVIEVGGACAAGGGKSKVQSLKFKVSC